MKTMTVTTSMYVTMTVYKSLLDYIEERYNETPDNVIESPTIYKFLIEGLANVDIVKSSRINGLRRKFEKSYFAFDSYYGVDFNIMWNGYSEKEMGVIE